MKTQKNRKLNIAVVTGGDSSEYSVSLKTAATVARTLDKNRYIPYIITIRNKEWYLGTPGNRGTEVNKNDFSIILNGEVVRFDCVFMTIHGTPGEDGKLPAYFDMLKIPYTCSSVLTSALTFNKFATKVFISNLGINTPRGVLLTREKDPGLTDIALKIGFPCFVKPNNSGSSFGITKVKEESELNTALEKAFKVDNEVLVEKCVDGMELSGGMLKTPEREIIFPPTELVSKTEFFDFAAKYEGASEEITPARLPEKVLNEFRKMSSFIYNSLQCNGIVRIDYFYSNRAIYFLELNTVPGMTDTSIVPQQIEAMGLKLSDVFTMSVEDAISRSSGNRIKQSL